MPLWLKTFVWSMLPVVELRGGLPIGLSQGLPWPEAYLFAVLGNLLPVIPILLLLEPISNWMRRHWKWAEKLFSWLFERTRRRTTKYVEKYGTLGLTLFVMIPLPVTGAWTGALAAFLFGIPLRRAVPAIIAGVLIAGGIVSAVYYGGEGLIRALFLGG